MAIKFAEPQKTGYQRYSRLNDKLETATIGLILLAAVGIWAFGLLTFTVAYFEDALHGGFIALIYIATIFGALACFYHYDEGGPDEGMISLFFCGIVALGITGSYLWFRNATHPALSAAGIRIIGESTLPDKDSRIARGIVWARSGIIPSQYDIKLNSTQIIAGLNIPATTWVRVHIQHSAALAEHLKRLTNFCQSCKASKLAPLMQQGVTELADRELRNTLGNNPTAHMGKSLRLSPPWIEQTKIQRIEITVGDKP